MGGRERGTKIHRELEMDWETEVCGGSCRGQEKVLEPLAPEWQAILSPGPLEEQKVLLVAEPSLQPQTLMLSLADLVRHKPQTLLPGGWDSHLGSDFVSECVWLEDQQRIRGTHTRPGARLLWPSRLWITSHSLSLLLLTRLDGRTAAHVLEF